MQLNEYVNQNGRRIRATEKAYQVIYKPQGYISADLYEVYRKHLDEEKKAPDSSEELEGSETDIPDSMSAMGDQDESGQENTGVAEENLNFPIEESTYEKMDLPELKELLKQKGIAYSSKAKKAELIALLKEKDSGDADEDRMD